MHLYDFIPLYLLFFIKLPSYRTSHSFPTRRSSDLRIRDGEPDADRDHAQLGAHRTEQHAEPDPARRRVPRATVARSEEHTSELQSQFHLVCRLLLEKKKRIGWWRSF